MKVILPKLKSQLLAMLMLLLVAQAYAQTPRKADVIILRDESRLEVLIQEVDNEIVKYKKLSDPEGPLFSVKKSEIASIRYGNGEVETFEATLEVQSYYSPTKPEAPQREEPKPVRRAPVGPVKPSVQFADDVRSSSPEHLRSMYKYYKSHSKTGMIMGIVGTSVGIVVAGIGTGIVASAVDDNGNFKSYQDELRARKGAYMMVGGFAGAATFGTVGFIKAGKNGSKASRIRRELIRRGEPLTFGIRPSFNPMLRTGNVTFAVNF
ncbi:hypothetical protein GCM10010967_49230 [Dyadobacter beijingensis]|uniref:Uncharacterized protein n=1 Tax=Dyadobacter beijingensis TaxID=365489 RepID=A0ABQ2IFW8_9BACT|nr:hypothetical protein [Dyadobacter beijingensis]GGN07782.1 hypothetical protein GCM10010967_49230 [Dyadobacter beijingensis]